MIFPAAEQAASNTGRPSLRTPETVLKICAAIRQRGHSDTHAAALAGVSSSAVSRWRQEDEEFALLLDTARADYLDVRLQVINETRKRDGSLDWRAQAWLMQVAAPETYGTPSRRFSLARAKEEKERAEAKAKADEGKVFTPEIMESHQQWHAYSVAKMNGASEEEARWLGHFLHHDPKPVFPGSLAIAGAEIGPGPEYTPQELAELAKYRARREAAKRATAERQAAERRAEARARGEAVEAETVPETQDAQIAANLPETRVAADRGQAAGGEAGDAGGPAQCPGGTREISRGWSVAEPPGAIQSGCAPAGVPEASTAKQTAEMRKQNETIVPETRATQRNGWRDDDTPHGDAQAADGASDYAMEVARRRAATDAYLDKLLPDTRGRKAAAERNGANVPESAPQTAGAERLANREIGVPRVPRPPASAAAEAKEWRRINQLMEEQFERSTDRAITVAEAAGRDALPGMWAGF
ncbi:MAG TPA: hypothetical protein VGO11_27250 [Chthoniobacteraceae bacterium]|nr:hypothetical protein [Chthoniobacteraceae bacterium]